MRLMIHSGTIFRPVSAIPWERGRSADIRQTGDASKLFAVTTPCRAADVAPVAYVGASDQLQIEERRCTTTT
jgi:hypothetical protein